MDDSVETEGPAESSPLALDEVIDAVLRAYPLLRSSFEARNVAAGEQLEAFGRFDLKLKGGGTSGPLGFYRTHRYGVGAEQPTYWGGRVFGGYRTGRGNIQPWFGERQTDDGGEFKAGVSIPLARNRAIDERRAELWKATFGREAVEPGIRRDIIQFVQAASFAYWDWVAAGRNVRIAEELLEIAVERQEGLRKRVEAEDLPPIELTDNRRLIVSREAKLIDAQRKLRQTAVKLSLFYRAADGRPIVVAESRLPQTFPDPPPVGPERLRDDIARALSNRPELQQLEFKRRQLEVDLSQARNLYRPSVEALVVGSKDVGGASSSKRDKTPFELEAGVQVEVPWQRRKARGKIASIEGKLAQLSAKQQFTEDKIVAEVRNALVALEAAGQRVRRARESLELARTMERAERRKYDLGDSDLLSVNLREQASADAAITVVEALQAYFVARAAYRAALGLDRSDPDSEP